MVLPVAVVFGWFANRSRHCDPLTVVDGAAVPVARTKSLPGGPLKLLACLTIRPHASEPPPTHGVLRLIVISTDAPEARFRFLTCNVLPDFVPTLPLTRV